MNVDYDTFIKGFLNSCEDSYQSALFEQCRRDPEMLKASAERDGIYREIQEKIGDFDLMQRFEIADISVSAFREEYILELAFRECLHLLRWMEVL